MSTALVKAEGYTPEEVELIKSTICVGATDDELKLFIMQCIRTKLDPFSRQIYAIKRWNSKLGREVMTVQTSIDGFRLVAERTENYAPGPKPTYRMEDGQLVATAYVKKWVRDGWHVVDADAYYNEYVVRKKNGEPEHMWQSKPRIMLAKCAEALALRRAFPQELSGIYTSDELPADSVHTNECHEAPPIVKPSTNGKPEHVADRATLSNDMMNQLRAVGDYDGLKAAFGAMSSQHKSFFNVKDEHSSAVIKLKDQLKYGFLCDRIDALCATLAYDRFKLGLIAQEVGADLDKLDSNEALTIIAKLEHEASLIPA